METQFSQTELITWLEVCLQNENLTNISADVVGQMEKGDNFLSDIIFVKASGEAKNGSRKEFNLVLKCSKKNKILREMSNVKKIFTNEIHVYDRVIQTFTKFQEERGLQNVFTGVPKYYGCFFTDDQEVVAFEDLTKRGYSLWDKKKPMLKKHILLVLEEYAKFHAISVAMQDQEPELYNKLSEPFDLVLQQFIKKVGQFVQNFVVAIEETHELLENELSHEALAKWKRFGEKLKTDFIEILKSEGILKVINHGDSWNNNFLFKTEKNTNFPVEVSIIDWQFARSDTPISDLSHFLFSCISEEDLEDFDNILEVYYYYFSKFLEMLKSDPKVLYSKENFLEDWRKYCKLGIAQATVVWKVCSAEKDEAPDVAKAAEDGNFAKAFQFDLKNKTLLKSRIKPIINYVTENNLI